LRDLLIGISVAHPSGTITKAGGMVVKNVTGFDLSRVYHGSLGTLGVIVSANFKVLPLPRADATLLLVTSSLAAALDAAGRVRASRVEPAALESALIDGQWLTAVRLAGHATTVRSLTDDTRNLLDGDVELLDKEASAGWWRSYLDGQSLTAADDEAVIRCSVRPRDIATFALGIDAEMARLGVAVPLLAASVGLGSVVARLRLSDGDADRLAEIQTVLLALAENATILAAPAAWKRGLDVWGRVPPTLAIMRELKEQFDPRRVLNPGRFAGGI
jgi:glycolate oxidase FAD binding subunit